MESSTQLERPKAILFDMGGVLLPASDKWDAAQYEVSFPEGIPEPEQLKWFLAMSEDIMRTFIALPLPRPAMDVRCFIETWLWTRQVVPEPEIVGMWHDTLCQWEANPLYEFVPATIRALHDMGMPMGVVSNTLMPGTYIRRRFEEAGILDMFDHVVFSAEFGVNKPDPRIFQHALDALCVRADEAWYVGDKPQRDVCGARGAGMTAVLVDSQHLEHINDSPDYVPHMRVRNIAQLPGILSEL